MKTTNRLFSLFAAIAISATMLAEVVYEPLEVASGFNRDVIAESYPITTSNVISYLRNSGTYYCMATASVIASVNTHLGYSQADIDISSESGWPDDNGNPDDRIIRVVAEASANPLYKDVFWKLAPYDQPNVLTIRPDNEIGCPGTIKFKKVGCYNKVFYLLASAFDKKKPSVRTVDATVYYTEGEPDHDHFEFAGLSGKDKDGTTGHRVRMINIYEGSTGFQKNTSRNSSGQAYAAVFDMDVDSTRLIDRIEFTHDKDCTAVMIFGVTGRTANMKIPNEEVATVSDIATTSFDACWEAIAEAASYRLDVAEDIDFQHLVEGYNNLNVGNTTCQEVAGLLANNDYYWRIRSVNTNGGQSASSAPRHVRTAPDPTKEGYTPPATNEENTDIEEQLGLYIGLRNLLPELDIYRSLWRDGAFNTLCLPFDMNAEQIAASPLAGVQVYEYVRGIKVGDSQLNIEVRATDHIEAGIPCLIKWEMNETQPMPTPLVFQNVNVVTSTGQTLGGSDEVRFVGNIGIAHMVVGDHNNLFLGAANTLYWPDDNEDRLKGFRAYFQVPTGGAQAVARNTPARIVEHHQTTTDMITITENKMSQIESTRKVLRDGQIYILRDGKTYTILGQNVE